MKIAITEILQELYSPFLIKWANKIGLEGVKLEDYQKQSFKKGIDNHNNIEQEIKINGFKDYETIFIEKDLENQYIKGRCDFIAKKNGIYYIFDFKSNDKIYLSHKLQLVAYKYLFGHDCKIGIICLSNKKETILNIDEQKYLEIFKALYLIKKNKKILNEF